MKILISKEALLVSINRTQGAITDRSLAQVGLCAEGKQLKVSAADRVLAVYSTCDCEVLNPGKCFVPARLFADVVKELPDGMVQLNSEGSFLTITAGDSRSFSMKLPLISDMPWVEPLQVDSDNGADVSSAKLRYAIDQIQFCVSHDSPRNYGTVGYLHRSGPGSIRLVGTDGFRLSYSEMDSAVPDTFLKNGVCISKRALGELHRMCSEGTDKIHIAISQDETTLVAEIPNYQIFIRLSAVKYPNYMGVVPERKMNGILLGRNQLQNVVKRVLLAADKSRALQLSFSNSSLTLNSKTVGSSESREVVPLEDYHGPRFDVAVNGKYLTDIFSTTEGENFTLHFSQENNEDPVVIVPRSEPSDCRSKHVLVPIKQND